MTCWRPATRSCSPPTPSAPARRLNRQIGIDKCVAAGAVVSSTETVLFEMLEQAGSDEFKAISRLVR